MRERAAGQTETTLSASLGSEEPWKAVAGPSRIPEVGRKGGESSSSEWQRGWAMSRWGGNEQGLFAKSGDLPDLKKVDMEGKEVGDLHLIMNY